MVPAGAFLPAGSTLTCGNVLYLLLFGWWLSLLYVLVAAVMFLTVMGAPYGEFEMWDPHVGLDELRTALVGPISMECPCSCRDTDGCVPAGRLCWDLAGYFLWPFGKVIQKVEVGMLLGGSLGVLCAPPDVPPLPRSPNPIRCVKVAWGRAQPCSGVPRRAAGAHGAGWALDTG